MLGLSIAQAVTHRGESLEWGRARQGLVPDFRLRLPTPEGLTDHLAELKFIGAGVSWYPRGVRGKGCDRRANGLPLLYKRALERLDTRYHNTVAGQTGPLVRRLQSFGNCGGQLWGRE